MAETLTIPTFEQISVVLSRLATDYNNMARIFYDIFYNETPMTVTLKMFDESGTLQTYEIPNRAMDREFIINGDNSPEGQVSGALGALYQDLANGNLYVKQTPEGTTGWSKVLVLSDLETMLIQGQGSPEGVQFATRGTLYVDKVNAGVYLKTTETGTEGWQIVSANTTVLADRSLSNLTEAGEAHFANPSLSNLSTQGQRLLDNKESISNKVTELTAESTDIQYPSAKAVYNAVTGTTEPLANRSLSNLTEAGEYHFLGLKQTRDCVLSAPQGVLSYSGSTITLPYRMILLGANGLTEDGKPNNVEVTITSEKRTTLNWISAGEGIIFYDLTNGILRYCNVNSFFITEDTPETVDSRAIWFNPVNYTYCFKDGELWTQVVMAEVGHFKTDEVGEISVWDPVYPIKLSTQEDLYEKANRDLSNVKNITQVRVVTEAVKSGATWRRVYDDKWCECGGVTNSGSTVTFPYPFIDNVPTVVASTLNGYAYYSAKSATSVTLVSSSGSSVDWVARGYLR